MGLEKKIMAEKDQQPLRHRHPHFLGASSHKDWTEALVFRGDMLEMTVLSLETG